MNALRSIEHSLPISLLRAREAVMARFRPLITSYGLTEQQWRVIRALAETDELSATQLAEICCILHPSLTRIFRTLENKKLIKRRRSRGDGRVVSVSLTDQGRSLFEEIAPQSEKLYRQLEAELGQDEIERLLVALSNLRKI